MIRMTMFIVLMTIGAGAVADQKIDSQATALIREATTSEEFSNDWMAQLPEDPVVPSPRDVLGYTIGTPGELTHVDDIHHYMGALAKASQNVELISLGKSFEGREMITVLISDASTIARLEEYRAHTNALADPRITSADEAAAIIAKAKPIYWVTGGLHSTELGPPEASTELAYRLAVDQREVFAEIRANVIVMITPVLEVDGRARQVEWYRQHLTGFNEYDDRPPLSPPFWGYYSFHDNNRDGLSFSQPLTQNYVKGFYHWKPTLSLDMHESVPILYVSTGTGPYNTAVDPITVTEWQSIANYEVSRLTAKGMPGVWTWGFYTGWFPGYLLWVTNNHNANGRFYETLGNLSAHTMDRDLGGISMAGDLITDRTWYRAKPPEREFVWSMRNNVNYMQSAVIASLELVARSPRTFLENFYQKGVNGMTRPVAEAPYAWSIPLDQSDRSAAGKLVEVLQQHGIEMQQAAESFELGEDDSAIDGIARGDVLILLNQPYGALAQNLLEKQEFPSDVQVPPYDDVAWTLGLHFGVKTVAVDNEDILSIRTAPLAADPFGTDQPVTGRKGRYLVVAHKGQSSLGPLRFALGDTSVFAARQPFQIGKTSFGNGSLIIDSEGRDRGEIARILTDHAIDAIASRRLPEVDGEAIEMHSLDLPRVAVYNAWFVTQNAGWVRFSMDNDGVPYTLISKDEVRRGGLKDHFDVLVFPSMYGTSSIGDIIGGVNEKWSPLSYKTTQQTPSLGRIMQSDDITGGLGFEGMAEIEEFIKRGGTLVGLSDGGVVVAGSGIVRDITATPPIGVNTPGSMLSTRVLGDHPLTWGYDTWNYVFRTNGLLYQVADHNRDLVMMQFGSKQVPEPSEHAPDDSANAGEAPPLVRSGAILSGAAAIDGAPALLHTTVGDGHVVLFAWNPLHRNLNHHDHAFFYNALLNWNDFPARKQ